MGWWPPQPAARTSPCGYRTPLGYCAALPRSVVTTVSLLPVDSTMYGEPGYTGFASRNNAGIYSYNPAATIDAGTAALCHNGRVRQRPYAVPR